MDIGHIRPDPDPTLRQQMLAARQERAETFRAGLRMIAGPVAALVRSALDHWRRRKRRKGAASELSALSDRELRDIGLTRGQIDNVATALAMHPPDVRLTLADLQRAEAERAAPARIKPPASPPPHRRPRPRGPGAPTPSAAKQSPRQERAAS